VILLWLLTLYFFKQVAFFLLFLLLFWSAGKLILKDKILNRHNSIYLDYFFSSIIGLSIIIIFISIISLVGITYKPIIYLLFLFLYGLRFFKYKGTSWKNLILLLLIYLPIISLTQYPPYHWDDISYHLPISQSIIEHRGLVFNKYIRYPVFPINSEMLFTFGLFFGITIPQLLSSISFFILLVGSFGYIEKFTKTKINGFIVYTILLSSQLLVYLSVISYVDILLTTFITSGILSLIIYFDCKDKILLYISGVSLGTAVGIKYTAIIICIIAGLIYVTAIYLYKLKWKNLFIYILIILIVGLPWYIRNFYYTGNPVWPFMNNLFGYSDIWSHSDYVGQFNDFKRNGVPKSISNFLRIPIYLSTVQHQYIALNPLSWFGFIILIVFMRKKISDFYLVIFLLLYTVIWFFSVNLIRYYALIIPIFSLISAKGFGYFLSSINNKKIKYPLLICILITFLYGPYNYIQDTFKQNGDPPVNKKEYSQFLSNKLPTYQATKFIQKLDGITYGLLNENMYFYGKGKMIGDWFGEAKYLNVIPNLSNEVKLYNSLKKLNVNYLLINKLRISQSLLSSINYKTKFKKIYEDKGSVVYKLID
jgi:hypothetical protein